mgnify:CR=1 FL=1
MKLTTYEHNKADLVILPAENYIFYIEYLNYYSSWGNMENLS